MYISRIMLDPGKKMTAEALFNNRSLLHSAFENSVEGARPHILWRAEPDMLSILALSREIPYLGDIQNMYGNDRKRPSTKPYDAHLDMIDNGMWLIFRVTVNPVIDRMRKDPEKGKSRRDVPLNLKSTENQSFCAEDWTRKKIEQKGARILEIHDIRNDTVYFVKDGKSIPIYLVTYDGILTVENKEKFRTALTDGIGGKKTYGSGMLTVAQM